MKKTIISVLLIVSLLFAFGICTFAEARIALGARFLDTDGFVTRSGATIGTYSDWACATDMPFTIAYCGSTSSDDYSVSTAYQSYIYDYYPNGDGTYDVLTRLLTDKDGSSTVMGYDNHGTFKIASERDPNTIYHFSITHDVYDTIKVITGSFRFNADGTCNPIPNNN